MSTKLKSVPNDFDSIEVQPLSDIIGAEIRGVDLSKDLSPAALDAVHQVWLQHSVIVLRDQRLSDGDLVRFSKHFGVLDFGPNMAWQPEANRDHPEIFVISNVVENGNPIGFLGDTEVDWHTDLCHTDLPPKASTLYAMEIPTDGSGNTGYMNMYTLLDALPDDLRIRLDGLQLKHEDAHTLQGELRYGLNEGDLKTIEDAPGPVHPLIRTHPETGRKCLYLGRQWNGEHRATFVDGMSRAESDALLDEIWTVARKEDCAWYHEWQAGDFVMWDNRCVMHRRGPFPSEMRRIMHRTQIRDTAKPF
ncbi:MAG: TauD/TfdA family dioxygenase [Alphaproteobacteria bacterium]|nr:TauD/TfdA family dioxygenase [Alphaproteobacteria bacterium]